MDRTYSFQSGIELGRYLIFIRKELFRKSIHLCTGFVPILLHFQKTPALILLTMTCIFYSVCEVLRMKGYEIPVISAVTAAAARKRDENHFVLGPVTLVCGIISASLMWGELPAACGICALAFGDGLASVAGKLFGRIVIPFTQGKTAAGSLTCFFAIFCSTQILTGNTLIALVTATCGAAIEVLPLKDFDNLVIPILLGGLVSFLLPQI